MTVERYLIMAIFVICDTAYYILHVTSTFEEVTTKQGVLTYFTHPVFMANACINLQFVLINLIAWPYLTLSQNKPWFNHKSSYRVFFYPAVLAYCDCIFSFFGIM